MSQIVRRLGTSPAKRGSVSGANCPDVLQRTDGQFIVIGKKLVVSRIEPELARHGASVGTTERAVLVPNDCMTSAAREIVRRIGPGVS